MKPFHLEEIGMHYALTLKEWRRRFLDRLPEVRHLGFDERFVRMWDYYLGYCEGAFREGYIGDVQLLLSKVASEKPMIGELEMASVLLDSRNTLTAAIGSAPRDNRS